MIPIRKQHPRFSDEDEPFENNDEIDSSVCHIKFKLDYF